MSASRWICPTVLVVLATAGGLTPSSAAQQLGAKVTETLMGPRTQRLVMSDDGDHLAIVAPKGSREIVLIDGTEGPVFDEIPLNFAWSTNRAGRGSIVFSPTGGRSAYVGRRAGDFIAVVDGREATPLSTPATLKGLPYTDPAGWNFWFNHDGSRLAYGATVEPPGWVMVADGAKGPAYRAFDMRQTRLIGKRLIYVAQTPDQQWHAVVDGKPGPGYGLISNLQVTPDGAHYAFIGNKSGVGAQQFVAVVDGLETVYYSVSDLELAPDGRVAYMAVSKREDPNARVDQAELIVGGMSIANTTPFGVTIRAGLQSPLHRVAWNPDGKRFAYVQRNTPNPGVQVMVNGKPMGPAYQTANELRWSPDGSHLFYLATSPTGTFPVMDGQELNAYHWIKEFQWSPDGKRYAFFGANATGVWMVIDGKEQPKAIGMSDNALTFSSDSRHVAYGAQTSVNGFQPVVDGVMAPVLLGNFATRVQYNPQTAPIPLLIYSPDGNHLAYTGRKDAMSKGALWVDGVAQQGPMDSYFHPAWSPDSKHVAAVISTGTKWVIMLDGKLSQGYDDIIILNNAGARFVNGHTYRFYAVKGTDIYRVTLDLGS